MTDIRNDRKDWERDLGLDRIPEVARRKRVYMAFPHLDKVEFRSVYSAMECSASGKYIVQLMERCSSLLANGLNEAWCDCLNSAEPWEYFCVLHADVYPRCRDWLDRMIEGLEERGLDALHACIPIKDQLGIVSTALGRASDPWSPCRRLSLCECRALHDVFTIDDIRGQLEWPKKELCPWPKEEAVLLPNTGCLVIKLRPWKWAFPGFTIRDRLVMLDAENKLWPVERGFPTRLVGKDPFNGDEDRRPAGLLMAQVIPEDWGFGRWMAANGLKVGGTTRIQVDHYGTVAYSSNGLGLWTTDQHWTKCDWREVSSDAATNQIEPSQSPAVERMKRDNPVSIVGAAVPSHNPREIWKWTDDEELPDPLRKPTANELTIDVQAQTPSMLMSPPDPRKAPKELVARVTPPEGFERPVDKLPHFHHRIQGWFDFEDIYQGVVRAAREGDCLVEVGCFLGKSLAFLAVEAANSGKGLKVFAVDHFQGDPGAPELDMFLALAKASGRPLEAQFRDNMRAGGVWDKITLIARESTEAATEFEDGSLFFVFIDGSHDREAVTADIRAWLPKVRPGGIIGGHDYDKDYDGVRAAVADCFGRDFIVQGRSWLHQVPADVHRKEMGRDLLQPAVA